MRASTTYRKFWPPFVRKPIFLRSNVSKHSVFGGTRFWKSRGLRSGKVILPDNEQVIVKNYEKYTFLAHDALMLMTTTCSGVPSSRIKVHLVDRMQFCSSNHRLPLRATSVRERCPAVFFTCSPLTIDSLIMIGRIRLLNRSKKLIPQHISY